LVVMCRSINGWGGGRW